MSYMAVYERADKFSRLSGELFLQRTCQAFIVAFDIVEIPGDYLFTPVKLVRLFV
jgi:hypothetical protein